MESELQAIIKNKDSSIEEKELATLEILNSCILNKDYEAIITIMKNLKNIWENLTTARTTKIIKKLFDLIPYSQEDFDKILNLLDGLISWTEDENKKMLKLDLECKRIYALLKMKKYADVLKRIDPVVKELKRYDDKVGLITVYIYESKAYYETKNYSKSKSGLASARALAVSAYCPAQLQAQIDLLSGMYICDDRNYTVAFSYFLEALDGFTLDKAYVEARVSLRYLILSKIISKKWDEINAVTKHKNAIRHLDDDVIHILIKISESCKNRDLKKYSEILIEFSDILKSDNFIFSHLEYLYDLLLDSNIIKIIEPYSNVKIDFISNVLGFTNEVVEEKLRKMILDSTINGILDFVNQCLIINEEKEANNFVEECLKQIELLDRITSTNQY